MPAILVPTPNIKPADLRRAGAVAFELALGVRFRGGSPAAARFVVAAAPIEASNALAADDNLALIRTRRALQKAQQAGDLAAMAQLRPRLARLSEAAVWKIRRA